MAQQINLYNPELRRKREWWTLTNAALAAGLFAVVLVSVGAYFKIQSRNAASEVVALDVQMAQAMQQMQQVGAPVGRADAEKELKQLQESLAARREVLVALQAGTGLQGDATVGFADYLRGLARQSVSGLWLTGFAVQQGGEGIEIRGRMTVADRLPDYIQKLNGEKVFQGRQFMSLAVDRPVVDAAQKPGLTPFNAFVLTAVTAKSESGANKGANP